MTGIVVYALLFVGSYLALAAHLKSARQAMSGQGISQ